MMSSSYMYSNGYGSSNYNATNSQDMYYYGGYVSLQLSDEEEAAFEDLSDEDKEKLWEQY